MREWIIPMATTSPDVSLELSIPRPVPEVRAWWLEMPPDYRATDPREQPFRIKTLSRTATEWRILTYWRVGGRVVKIPERFEIRPDGWTVHLDLPFGLKQRDEFVVTPEGAAGTRVQIDAFVTATGVRRLLRPAFRVYARRSYPKTWRTAAELCARDAPKL